MRPLQSIFLVILVSLITFSTVSAAPVLFNGHYYELVSYPRINWYEARDYAAGSTYNGMQGHLVTITSQAEEDFLINTFPEIGGQETWIWLGGSDESSEGVWSWITGEPWSYTNWDVANNEPNGEGDENCLEYTDGTAKWNDENCNSFRDYFLVEYEPETAGTTVPTLSEWGMIIFFTAAGFVAVYYLRRRGMTLI